MADPKKADQEIDFFFHRSGLPFSFREFFFRVDLPFSGRPFFAAPNNSCDV